MLGRPDSGAEAAEGLIHSRDKANRPRPVATSVVLALTGIVTSLPFFFGGMLGSLERTPYALRRHEWWRLITPLFVHSGGWRQIGFNFLAIFVLGSIVERIFTRREWLGLYFTAGIVGEIVGYAWQPYGAGASVAGAGLLGGLAAWLLLTPKTIPARAGGIVLLLGAVILVAVRDIHGPPILAGAGLGWAMLRKHERARHAP